MVGMAVDLRHRARSVQPRDAHVWRGRRGLVERNVFVYANEAVVDRIVAEASRFAQPRNTAYRTLVRRSVEAARCRAPLRTVVAGVALRLGFESPALRRPPGVAVARPLAGI